MQARGKLVSFFREHRKTIIIALITSIAISFVFGYIYWSCKIHALTMGRFPDVSKEAIEADLIALKPVIRRNTVIYSIIFFIVILFPNFQWKFWQIERISLLKLLKEKLSRRK